MSQFLEKSINLVMSFPDKDQRQKCWLNRDIYWGCLDKNVDSSTASSPQQELEHPACKELRALYMSSCPAQWVKHFDRKREYLKFKTRIETEGYEPVQYKK